MHALAIIGGTETISRAKEMLMELEAIGVWVLGLTTKKLYVQNFDIFC